MLRVVLITLLVLVIVRALWRLLNGVVQGARGRPQQIQQSVPMTRDPVCGTYVVPSRAVVLADGRQQVYFCSIACRDKYRARSA